MKISLTAPTNVINKPKFKISLAPIDDNTPEYELDLKGDF